jgi:hypothetical protein
MRITLVVCALILLPWTLSTVADDAAQKHCDPNLNDLPDSPHGYHLRGDRCEGIYHQSVSSLVLSLASFTTGPPNYDLNGLKSLTLEWTRPAEFDGAVRLRVRTLAKDLYYRMDTIRPSPETVYEWPVEVLKAQDIGADEISLLGWVETTVGNVDRRIYLPVSMKDGLVPEAPGDYLLVVYPGVRLNKVYVSIDQINTAGVLQHTVQSREPLNRNSFPEGRPVRIKLPELSKGLYYVEITGKTKSGESKSINAWLNIPE